jgi:hypothetical protein
MIFLLFIAICALIALRERRRRLAEYDRRVANCIMDSWKPKPKHSYRRHGRFARRPYASFTVRKSFYE